MKILVTGGAGYIGSVLVPMLLAKGHKVLVIDNFIYDQTSLVEHCYNPNFSVIRGDTRDERLLKDSLKKVDVILPLACLTGAPLCARFPHEAKTIILGAVKKILRHRSKKQIIIYPTTNSGYGIGEKGKICTEKTLLRPISLYGKLKTAAERDILEAGNSTSLRLATVFGLSPRMRIDLLVNHFVYRAVKDWSITLFEPHFKRNFIHARDVASAFLHTLSKFDKMRGEIYNVGLDSANLSKWELCEVIKKQIPHFVFTEAPTGEDPDKRDYIVSNAKITKTGFKPKHSLEMGISELIKGYQILHQNQYSNI